MSDTAAGFPHTEPRETLTKIDPPPGLSKPTTQQVGGEASVGGRVLSDCVCPLCGLLVLTEHAGAHVNGAQLAAVQGLSQ